VAAIRQSGRRPNAANAEQVDVIDRVADRVLWLAVRMIHEANSRPNTDGLKVGGHQASSASAVAILCALYLHWLRPRDLVSVKPHASPAYHALTYLLGALDRSYLTKLRSFGGLQSYPSRTKDPDRVDFSTGSVGLGAVAPLFASLADSYLRHHDRGERPSPHRRFVAVVGDAELDEGNVWEAVAEPALAGLGNVTLIVDANRQSLDRVVPGARIRQLERMFDAVGWQVLEAKYGRHLRSAMERPGGDALRRRIDEMANEEYQVLIRRPGAEARARCIEGAPVQDRDALARAIGRLKDADVPRVLADLGGHDTVDLVRTLNEADADRTRPSVVFAYTVKGWRLPFAGDSMNHSAHLTDDQVADLAAVLGADAADPWASFQADSPEGRLCIERGALLELQCRTHRRVVPGSGEPVRIEIRQTKRTSTQQAFGDALAVVARMPVIGPQVVTATPDVTVSTSLGGWVNRVGVFSQAETPVFDDTPRPLTWTPKPVGQHIELGISEMNLFLWLSQFGLTAELFDEPLIPIGAVYDPFICRGLDALVYALYVGARFILVGTPSGVTLAPEGGAHQSAITPSLGIELPGLHSYEPAFAQEVTWFLEEGIRGIQQGRGGFSTYLRLSTRPVDQEHTDAVRGRLGDAEWRRQALAGGYRLLRASDVPDLPADAPVVNVVAAGAVVHEAVAAVRELQHEEVAANLIVVTSPDRLASELHGGRLVGVRDQVGGDLGHLRTLIPQSERRAPMVTVHDAASHALAFLGGAFGAPVVPLGVDTFGQSGSIQDLYAASGIDTNHIVNAALLALELGDRDQDQGAAEPAEGVDLTSSRRPTPE
jgi:pyruvate dehydrogenase E1 component